jgi:hypothetical protein
MMPVVVFAFKHVLTRRTPMGRKEMHDVRFHGGPAFRIKRDDLDRRGVIRNQARMTGVLDGRAQLADGTVLDVTNVVWCTGFKQVFDWIRYRFSMSTAGRWSTAALSTQPLGSTSAACHSSTRSARWCFPGSAETPTSSPARSLPVQQL